MGWWKPYFFWKVWGVQVLLPSLVIEGWVSFLVVSSGIAGLCCMDRHLAHASTASSTSSSTTTALSSSSSSSAVAKDVLVYTLSRFTSGLVMLIMMSFNALLYLEVILFLGASEYYLQLRRKKLLLVVEQQQQLQQLQQDDSYDDGYRDDDDPSLPTVEDSPTQGQELRVI